MALAVGMVMLWLRRVCGRVRVQPASAPSWLANLRPFTRRKAAGGAHGSSAEPCRSSRATLMSLTLAPCAVCI